MLHDSPRLRNTCVRQVVLDKRFSLNFSRLNGAALVFVSVSTSYVLFVGLSVRLYVRLPRVCCSVLLFN